MVSHGVFEVKADELLARPDLDTVKAEKVLAVCDVRKGHNKSVKPQIICWMVENNTVFGDSEIAEGYTLRCTVCGQASPVLRSQMEGRYPNHGVCCGRTRELVHEGDE